MGSSKGFLQRAYQRYRHKKNSVLQPYQITMTINLRYPHHHHYHQSPTFTIAAREPPPPSSPPPASPSPPPPPPPLRHHHPLVSASWPHVAAGHRYVMSASGLREGRVAGYSWAERCHHCNREEPEERNAMININA